MAAGYLRRSSGGTVLAACVLCALSGSGAPAVAFATRPVVEAAPAQGGASEARRRRELYDLQRQDVAEALARDGVSVKWQQHSLAELRDWQDRVRAAHALQTQFSVYMDWRITALAELTELRLRAAKALTLVEEFGVRADWPRYSWSELEALRRHLAELSAVAPSTSAATARVADGDADRLAIPGTSKRQVGSSKSALGPDAIVEPTFASSASWMGGRSRARSLRPADPDAILVPTFAVMSTVTGSGAATSLHGADDIIDPFRPAFRAASGTR
jgi:hypothetical protein